MGLYGGLDVDDIHSKKKLSTEQKILDFMGSTELIANLFRISQTEESVIVVKQFEDGTFRILSNDVTEQELRLPPMAYSE